jgi:hypothetical protein
LQDQFPAVAGKYEVDTRALEVAGEQQMRVRNDDRVGRRTRRNVVDMDVPMGMSALTVR